MRRAVDDEALEPLRTALLDRARADAEEWVACMRTRTAVELEAATAASEQALHEARQSGETAAAGVMAVEDAAVRKQARAILLNARRAVYEELRSRTHGDVRRLRGDSVYRDLHQAMTVAGRARIGSDATVRDVDDGCVIEAPGRRVEVTLDSLADWALAGVLADSAEWTP